MNAYMGDAVLLYLRELIDWEAYFNWRKGEDGDVDADRAALQEVLETAAAICEEHAPALREGWEQNVTLEDGRVVYPPHIAAAMEAREHAKAELRLEKFVDEQFEQYASPLQQHWVDSILTRASGTLMMSGSDPEAHARSPTDDSPRSSDEHVASGLQDELVKS